MIKLILRDMTTAAMTLMNRPIGGLYFSTPPSHVCHASVPCAMHAAHRLDTYDNMINDLGKTNKHAAKSLAAPPVSFTVFI